MTNPSITSESSSKKSTHQYLKLATITTISSISLFISPISQSQYHPADSHPYPTHERQNHRQHPTRTQASFSHSSSTSISASIRYYVQHNGRQTICHQNNFDRYAKHRGFSTVKVYQQTVCNGTTHRWLYQEINYLHGQRHGELKTYHWDNGQAWLKRINRYHRGKMHGDQAAYDSLGRVLSTSQYHMGHKHGWAITYGYDTCPSGQWTQYEKTSTYWHNGQCNTSSYTNRRSHRSHQSTVVIHEPSTHKSSTYKSVSHKQPQYIQHSAPHFETWPQDRHSSQRKSEHAPIQISTHQSNKVFPNQTPPHRQHHTYSPNFPSNNACNTSW